LYATLFAEGSTARKCPPPRRNPFGRASLKFPLDANENGLSPVYAPRRLDSLKPAFWRKYKRKLLTIATLVTLGYVGAADAANSNVPIWSPYTMVPQGDEPSTHEARSAYTDRRPITPARGKWRASPDWSSIGLSPGTTGDYSNYF
jgi:hypothetical protein